MAKILIVDDIEYIQKSLVKLLNSEGFDSTSVSNGHDAWDIIQNEHYDLIITDIMMPKMDGFEFIENIRSMNQPRGEVPILAMSGGNKTIKSDLALDLAKESVDMILKKPFGKADLVEAVNKILSQESDISFA